MAFALSGTTQVGIGSCRGAAEMHSRHAVITINTWRDVRALSIKQLKGTVLSPCRAADATHCKVINFYQFRHGKLQKLRGSGAGVRTDHALCWCTHYVVSAVTTQLGQRHSDGLTGWFVMPCACEAQAAM